MRVAAKRTAMREACVALFRAVNVGGRSLPMADLRAALEELGFAGVRTLLQSGNAVFTPPAAPGRTLERRIEAALVERFGLRADVFVRSRADVDAIVAANPFPHEAAHDPARLVVMVLEAAPSEDEAGAVRSAVVGREQVRRGTRHLYLYYPDGQGTSKLTNAVIERRLGMRGTARNWNTVLKIRDALAH